jgi:hypothetical protein
VVPFHVQVSFKGLPLGPEPPKSTISPVAGSYAMEAVRRAGGLDVHEVVQPDPSTCVQVVPFHVQVSLKKPTLAL